MKKEIRILGLDDAPFLSSDKKVLVVGTVFRGGQFMDGLLSTYISKDGSDSTDKLVSMINHSKFKFRAIMTDGIAFGGFNIFDCERLSKETGLPVIIIIRNYPDIEKIERTLNSLGMGDKVELIHKAGEIFAYDNIFFQCIGISSTEAKKIMDLSITRGNIPEPVRLAHIIGSGIIDGESRGRA